MKLGRLLPLIVLASLLAAPPSPAAGAVSRPSVLLALGPLPLPLGSKGSGPLAPGESLVPEIDPLLANPAAGDQVVLDPRGSVTWTEVKPGADGAISLPKRGVYWIVARVELDRWTRLGIRVEGGDSRTVYVDGKRAAGPEEGAGKALEATVQAARGRHLVDVRVVRRSEGGERPRVKLSVSTDPAAGVRWVAGGREAPARFDEMRRVIAVGPIAVGQEGRMIARRLTFRDPVGEGRRSRVDVIRPDGTVVAASVGDATAVPIAFSPNAKTDLLLLRQKGRHGSDLVLFDPDTRTSRTILRDEPNLGFVHWGPGGTHLLIASGRGVKRADPKPDAPHRERALREKLPDYVTSRHLWLVEVATGARRELTRTGDWVLEDAAFVPAKRAVIYARTVPLDRRPWFATEIRWIDLIEQTDTRIITFQGGWESRPARLCASIDGKRLAFLGPPDQVGEGHPEHNVYNRQVWLLDLESKKLTRITSLKGPAFTLSRGELLSWDHHDRNLVAAASDGSVTRIVRVERVGEGWQTNRLGTIAESVAQPAVSPDHTVVVYAASGRAVPPEIHAMDVDSGKERVIERPNAGLAKIWRLSLPEKAHFKIATGRYLDAWWYPPTVKADQGKTPLIVYYYGGATPTTRRFNTTHQVLAANGYAVLVINPRGAIGYGQKFAEAHVDDWGPVAAKDIVTGIDAFLAAHPDIDSKRVGIYGGSYGGFLTEYLVSHYDRFAAAVAMYGISDISGYWGAGAWGYTYGDTALAGAFPWTAEKLFAGHSPVYNAEKIHTPLLLLHGEADRNVPVEQSKELYTALKVLGRPVELVLFPGEGHGIAGSWKDWVAHRTMMLDFFDRTLRGQPGAWNARWKEAAEAGGKP